MALVVLAVVKTDMNPSTTLGIGLNENLVEVMGTSPLLDEVYKTIEVAIDRIEVGSISIQMGR